MPAKIKTYEEWIQRFWRKVNKAGEDECWEWMAHKDKRGYGRYAFQRSIRAAHRVAYELCKGTIPSGKIVMHSCDNPPCVNPKHLKVGTHSDNSRDMLRKHRSNRQKISNQDAEVIRHTHARFIRLLARKYRLTTTSIHYIIRRQAWKNY